MAVATGIDPGALLALDGPLFEAVERAAAKRWTAIEELLAAQLEVAHATFAAYVAAHSKKGARGLPTLRVPRPTDDEVVQPEPQRMGAAAFARAFGPGGRN